MCCVRSTRTLGPMTSRNRSSSERAQTRARRRRGADRAVVLDEEHARAVGIVDDLGEIALVGAHACERFGVGAQRAALRHRRLVRGALLFGARVDHPLQPVVAERGAHRGDQVDGEIVVTIGEQILREIGERPHGRRPAATLARLRARRDEPVLGERVEMLTNAGLGHASARGEIGDRRVGALQPLDDLPLARAQIRGLEVGLDVIHRAVHYRKRVLAESIRRKGMAMTEVRAGTLAELEAAGQLLTKVGSLPVVVFWHDGTAYAIEDRCPHLGFPLHQGTVEAGLVTCHWHHARFDLVSGCTLDLWADDARGFDAEVRGGDVFVRARADDDPVGHLQTRLREGLEESITLVIAKSVLGLLDAGVGTGEIVRTGIEFGTAYRNTGWGAGLTVLVAMANLLPHLDPDDRALALTHGMAFVARDTANHPPRFPVSPLAVDDLPLDRLASWYRRFIDTRSSDAAERTLETALAEGDHLADVEAMMFAAATDHVFIDGGHTIDFTNKAFEALDHLGVDAASDVLPTLVRQTTRAQRSEEFSEWRHPHDLVHLAADVESRGSRHAGDRAKERSTSASSGGSCSPTIRRASRPRSSNAYEQGATDEESRARARVRGRAADRALSRAERPRRLGHRAPLVHGRERAAPSAAPQPDAGAAAGCGARRVPRLPRPVPQRARGPVAARGDGFTRRARAMLRRAGHGRRGGQRGVRVLARRRFARRAHRRARSRAARRRRRVPLVPDRRSRRSPRHGVARGLRGVRARSSSASRASSPPTRRPGASCRPSCESRRAYAAAKPCTKTKKSPSNRRTLSRAKLGVALPPRNQRSHAKPGGSSKGGLPPFDKVLPPFDYPPPMSTS